jgi:hypothetical protein
MRLVAILGILVACGEDRIEVKPASGATDYNHDKLVAAVDRFVVAQRTPDAYAELAQTIVGLRPGMDKTVAEEAELKLVVLALGPIKSVQAKPIDEQVTALATTVWPTLLSPRVEEDTLTRKRDPRAGELAAKPDEEPHAYLLRICGGVLATDCKHVVPELQGQVADALAIRHATERVRSAVSDCLMCGADPRWHDAVLEWEELDRGATSWISDVERHADPDNWPLAGAAAEDDPQLPEAEVAASGEIVVGGHTYGPNELRLEVFKEVRGGSDALALHVRPDITLAQLRGLLVDARKAGVKRVALVAREPVYPWRRKAYWVADGSGLRPNLRPTDVVQLLLHAVDEVSGPGTVARVD